VCALSALCAIRIGFAGVCVGFQVLERLDWLMVCKKKAPKELQAPFSSAGLPMPSPLLRDFGWQNVSLLSKWLSTPLFPQSDSRVHETLTKMTKMIKVIKMIKIN
jgi:hypothetical protein